MRGVLLFVLAWVLGVALVTWAAWLVVQSTTTAWFEKDVALRAELAATGARQALVSHWRAQPPSELAELLADITRDDRILGAAACTGDFELLTSTRDFPRELTCAEIGAHAYRESGASRPWHSAVPVATGDVHISAIPVDEHDTALGFVVLVHDLAFAQRRESKAGQFLLVAFGVLALAASLVTIAAVRLSWRHWSDQLRQLLRGDAEQRPEFQPLLRDVRELVERIVAEKDAEGEGGVWTPQRLKQTLARRLHGERIVILANREPYIHERDAATGTRVVHPASGLVTALEPIMRACSGTWIGHGSGSGDRDTVDRYDRVRVPPGEESYVLRRVWLDPEEERGYYYGFANEGLWPLCHHADTRPAFRSEDWRHYCRVNEKFADAVVAEVDSEDPIVLVQDYHFALAPKLIRKRLPRATIITFWHVPWPNAQRLGICPWRKELLEGMLGSSILGFHTHFDCNTFVDAVDSLLEARIDREHNAVVQGGRATLVRPYPISIEWPNRWLENADPVEQCRAEVFAELGLPPDALLGVGVDRLDYTKGVEERLLAVERLLERWPAFVGRLVFVQLAAPSRTEIERYKRLNDAVEQITERVNARFGRDGYRPIVLLRAHHEPPTVFRYYRAADFCYVSSLHDGMNLVAKEFVAARDDGRGVLVLSKFTGAARELTEALVVNPYDLDEASAAIATALEMSPTEQRERMRAMRVFVSEFNVYRWAGRMLVDAARLRSRDRLTGRLTDHNGGAARIEP